VGTIFGIDPDSYGPESWSTQPIRRGRDTDLPKARVLGARAHEVNPAVRVVTAESFAQDVPLWVFRQADVILVAADNLEVLIWTGQVAAGLGKPLIQGAVHGESWLALVRSYDLADPAHPCPACGLGEQEFGALRNRAGCDPNTMRLQAMEPTRALPCLCGASANSLVAETLKRLLALDGGRLESEELAYCLLSHRLWRTKVERNPDCRLPHERWDVVDVPAPPHEVTLSALTGRLPERTNLQIKGETPWASFTFCPRCEAGRVAIRRFGRAGDVLGHCSCGEPLVASPVGSHSMIPAADLEHVRETPLSQLGVLPGGAVAIATEGGWTYFFIGQPELPEPPDAAGEVPAKEEHDA
jgi:molybdopterin/thiamine biosynthesis adenylyltransferase